jgi:uncharacterized membrane protein YidH (DUF202 family)
MENITQEASEFLSKKNKKRFGKLLDSLSEKYSGVETENLQLKSRNKELEEKLQEANSPKEIQKKELLSEYELAYKEYSDAQNNYQETKEQLYPHSSATSSYGSEIVWFSVVVGLVFDFLLWKDIFNGKFGEDTWAERAERASAILMSFSYAFICAQLGAAYAVKMLVKKRNKNGIANPKEIEVYNKSTAKNTIGINLVLFSLLTLLSTAARFTQPGLEISDKFILSLAATTIGLVISAVAYWYTDVYDHFIKAAKNRELMARKNFIKVSKKVEQNI